VRKFVLDEPADQIEVLLKEVCVPSSVSATTRRRHLMRPTLEHKSDEWYNERQLEQRMATVITDYVGHVGDFVLLSRMLLNEIHDHNELVARIEAEKAT
jgi:hypothetical protein